MKKLVFLPILFSFYFFTACSRDSASSAHTFVREEEPHNSMIVYGYDRNGDILGDKQSFDECRNDVYRYYDNIDLENDHSRAYVYMGLAGKTGAYLYYAYSLYFPVKKKYSFQIKDFNTCVYQEIWSISGEARWTWNCNYSNTVKYSSHVGESGEQTLPSGNKTILEKSYSVIPTEVIGNDSPTFVLYSDETYIDVFVSGSQAHFIQRLPSYADLGVFYSR